MNAQDASIIKECISHLRQVQQALDNSAESIQENINIAENMMKTLTNTQLPLGLDVGIDVF